MILAAVLVPLLISLAARARGEAARADARAPGRGRRGRRRAVDDGQLPRARHRAWPTSPRPRCGRRCTPPPGVSGRVRLPGRRDGRRAALGRPPARSAGRRGRSLPEVLVLPAVGVGLIGFLAIVGGARRAAACWRRAAHAAARRPRRSIAALALRAGRAAARLRADRARPARCGGSMWAMPIAALVGRGRHPAGRRSTGRAAVRLLPALAVCALLAVAGTPVWQGRNTWLADRPASKRDPGQPGRGARARRGPAAGRPACSRPQSLSQTLLMIDGRVTAVAPRHFYTPRRCRRLAGGAA